MAFMSNSAAILAAFDAAPPGTVLSTPPPEGAALEAPGAAPVAAPVAALPVPGVRRTLSALTRWDRIFPGSSMPSDLNAAPFAVRMRCKDADPELFALLMGQPLPAATEAAILAGTWSDTVPAPPTPEAQRAAAVAALTQNGAVNPFAPGPSFNITRQVELSRVDPAAAEQMRLQAAPAIQQLQQQQAAAAEQHRQQVAAEAIEAANQRQIATARQRFWGHQG